jgi:hypothetical protein
MAAVSKDDVYVILDKEGKNLKAVGLMSNNTTINPNKFVATAMSIEQAKKNKSLSYSLKSLISTTELKKDDNVLVKVEFVGVATPEYLPGKVSVINVGGDVNVELYAYKNDKREPSAKKFTITAIPLSNIIKNIQVNEEYSSTTTTEKFKVSYIVKDKDDADIIVIHTDFNANSTVITAPVKEITINDAHGSSNIIEKLKFIDKPILTADGTDYLIKGTGGLMKSNERIPYYYTVVNTFTDPKDSSKPITVVRGGKKSKDKTRKNTMPLQFAPGAKRSYLKRRKSSRK